jgi:drug/metabolite transporter (DMT)-like permease
VQVLFGLHYLAAKLVVEEIPPRPWAFLRASCAGLILLSVVATRSLPLPRGGSTLARFFGLALLGVAINQYLFVEGISRTTPGHSSIINTSIPVVTLFVAVLLGRERPTLRRLLGIATTLVGVSLLIGWEELDPGDAILQGDLLTLGNALSYSLFLVLGKPVLEKERTLPATALLLCFGAVWLLPQGAPGLAAIDPSGLSARTWAMAGFIIIGPTIGAYVLSTYALRRVESSLVALFIYLQPVLGAGLSIVLGFEQPTARLFLACAGVFAGIYIALRAPSRVAVASPTPEP